MVDSKENYKFDLGVKGLAWNATNFIDLLASRYCISTQPFSTTCEHHYKIISEGNGKFVEYTCLKCYVHNKLTGLMKVYVGIGSLDCIINLLLASVGNVLMRSGYQGNGTEDFSNKWLFQTWKLSSWKPHLFLVTHSYSDEVVLRRIQYFIT